MNKFVYIHSVLYSDCFAFYFQACNQFWFREFVMLILNSRVRFGYFFLFGF